MCEKASGCLVQAVLKQSKEISNKKHTALVCFPPCNGRKQSYFGREFIFLGSKGKMVILSLALTRRTGQGPYSDEPLKSNFDHR